MADIFRKVDLQGLLRFKYVAMFGCSNMRALYKDLVCLWNSGTLLKPANLKTKLEQSFMGDRKKKGDSLFNGRNFEEEREFKEDGAHIEFYFITKCYTDNMERFFTEIKNDQSKAPDVIILSSALWDITRWGPNGVVDYRDNMVKLMESMKRSLPKNTLVIWLTELPVSNTCYGGLFVKQVEFMKHFLRFEVMEANLFARQLVVSFGFDVLDVHYYLRMQIHLRAKDGIHWLPVPLRYITNLTLTHIALSWNRTLPGNFQGPSLDRMKYIFNCDKTLDVPSTSVPTDIHDVLSKKSEQFASVSVCSAKKKKKRRKRAISKFEELHQDRIKAINTVKKQHTPSIPIDRKKNKYTIIQKEYISVSKMKVHNTSKKQNKPCTSVSMSNKNVVFDQGKNNLHSKIKSTNNAIKQKMLSASLDRRSSNNSKKQNIHIAVDKINKRNQPSISGIKNKSNITTKQQSMYLMENKVKAKKASKKQIQPPISSSGNKKKKTVLQDKHNTVSNNCKKNNSSIRMNNNSANKQKKLSSLVNIKKGSNISIKQNNLSFLVGRKRNINSKRKYMVSNSANNTSKKQHHFSNSGSRKKIDKIVEQSKHITFRHIQDSYIVKKQNRSSFSANRKKGTSIVNEVNRQHLTSIQVTIYNSIANKRACNSVHSGAPVQSIKKKQKKNPKKSTTRKKQYEADSTQSLLCNADNSSIFNLGSSMRGETALETEYWRDYDGCFPMPHSLNYINFTADFFNEDSITNFQSYDTHMSYGKEVVGPDRHLRNSLRKWRHSPYHGTYFQ